jgi:class 3 adenylate cyclase
VRVTWYSSITFKMTLLVLGGTIVVFALVLAYSYMSSREIILAEAEKNARNLTLSVARRVEQEFRAVAKVPESFARFLENSPCDKETLHRLIQELVAANDEIFGSTVAFEPYRFKPEVEAYSPYYYKNKGGLDYESLGTPSYNYFQHDWYHVPAVMKTPTWSEPYLDSGGGGVLMITYSCPFFDRDRHGIPGSLRGVVGADVSLEWLTRLLGSMTVGRRGYYFLTSNTGAFITHPNADYIMRESVFSMAEESAKPQWRTVGREMITSPSGFVDLSSRIDGEDSFLAYARIPSTGWCLGAVFPKDELLAELEELHRKTLIIAAVGICLLLAVSVLVARSIARPLRRMAEATGRVAQGDLDFDLSDIKSRDEVGMLAESFTRMTQGLKERDFIRNTFGRYLTREVVNRLLEHKDGLQLGGEARNISLIMSDIRGFTATIARMQPDQVISFLNRYLGKMVEIMMEYRGTIDEIIGDGILAFFGAPEPLEDHAARAVACALKMQAAMEEINALNEADGMPLIEMAVAVNTGEVVVGNIGSEMRTKYGAVGSQVNFTGRVESFTVGGQVLISESTYERLSDILTVGNILQVEMKGMTGKVNLYDVRGIGGTYDVHLPEKHEDLIQLKDRINVTIYPLTNKTVNDTPSTGRLTHLSMSRATLLTSVPVKQWDNLRMSLLDETLQPVAGEIYAKVVAAVSVGEDYEAVVRFTSVPPEAYGMFHQAMSA